MRITLKLLLAFEAILLVTILALVLPVRSQMHGQVIEGMQKELRAVASTGAIQIDGDAHSRIRTQDDVPGEDFRRVRDQVARIRDVNGISPDHIYTFYPDPEEGWVRWGVMTHRETWVGERYEMQPQMAAVLREGTVLATELYEDKNGRWISAYAPIRDSAGGIVGLLEVDRAAADYLARYQYVTILTAALGLVALGVSSILGWFALSAVVLRPMKALRDGMLALGRREFDHKVEIGSRDEFRDLGETLNKLARDLDVARVIQSTFLPRRLPSTRGYRFALASIACDATGGDYVDAFELPDGRAAVLVADVSGHGLGASLLMSACRSALRAMCRGPHSPGELLERLESQLSEDLGDSRFITMVYGVLEPDGRFTWANAGHEPAFAVVGGEVVVFEAHRTPLGVGIDLGGDKETTIRLSPGDRVFLGSDGVTEAMDPAGELFGAERIVEAVRGAGATCQEVVDRLNAALDAHCRGPARRDDVTMLVLDRIESGPS